MKESELVSLRSLLPYIKISDLKELMNYISASWWEGELGLKEELEKRDGELRQVSEHVVRFNDDALRVLSQDI